MEFDDGNVGSAIEDTPKIKSIDQKSYTFTAEKKDIVASMLSKENMSEYEGAKGVNKSQDKIESINK
jgi:hypothetical protein